MPRCMSICSVGGGVEKVQGSTYESDAKGIPNAGCCSNPNRRSKLGWYTDRGAVFTTWSDRCLSRLLSFETSERTDRMALTPCPGNPRLLFPPRYGCNHSMAVRSRFPSVLMSCHSSVGLNPPPFAFLRWSKIG